MYLVSLIKQDKTKEVLEILEGELGQKFQSDIEIKSIINITLRKEKTWEKLLLTSEEAVSTVKYVLFSGLEDNLMNLGFWRKIHSIMKQNFSSLHPAFSNDDWLSYLAYIEAVLEISSIETDDNATRFATWINFLESA